MLNTVTAEGERQQLSKPVYQKAVCFCAHAIGQRELHTATKYTFCA